MTLAGPPRGPSRRWDEVLRTASTGFSWWVRREKIPHTKTCLLWAGRGPRGDQCPGRGCEWLELMDERERQGWSSVDPWGLDVTLRIGYHPWLALGRPLSTHPQSPGHPEQLPSQPRGWPSLLSCSHRPKRACVSERPAAKALSTKPGSSHSKGRVETKERVWWRLGGSSENRASSGVHMDGRGHSHPIPLVVRRPPALARALWCIFPPPSCFKPRSP